MENKSLIVPGEGAIRAVDPAQFPDLQQAAVGINIDPKYKEFKDGESIRCIFCGITIRNIKGEDLPTVVLQTKEGFWMNSGVTLVGQLEKIAPGTPIQVTYAGKKNVPGTDGGRANMFVVNLLNVGPVETQTVSVPSSPPAPTPPPPAAPAPPAGPAPKDVTPRRPYEPEYLQQALRLRIAKHTRQKTIATQADRGILAVVLNTTFKGDEIKRRVLTGYLIGKEHIKDMSQAEVMALLDWLDCHRFDSAPPQQAITEALAAYEKAIPTP